MENKLIPMVDFVLEQYKVKQSPYNFWKKTEKYANFLKQPLKLGMFLPCDENDVPLVEPETWQICHNNSGTMSGADILLCQQYEQAKERVLFEGFDFDPHLTCEMYFTIEDLINLNLTLTPNALKQFEL